MIGTVVIKESKKTQHETIFETLKGGAKKPQKRRIVAKEEKFILLLEHGESYYS